MRIIICGAGIAGLAAARSLIDQQHEIVIIEKSPGPRRQGYMIDFFGPGYDAAETLGVLEELRAKAHAIDRVSYVNARGHRTATMRYDTIASSQQGRLMSLMRPDLEEVLRSSVADRVEFRWSDTITAVHNAVDGVEVDLASGERLSGDLLIGADGIHSSVRQMVIGPESDFLRPLGFHTAAWIFADAEIRALVGDRWLMTDTIDAEIGLYGLDGDRVAAFGVHRESSIDLPDDIPAAVRRAYTDLGWIAPKVVGHCPPPEEVYYDLVAQVELPRWTDRRVVLVGDACQAVSLIAGQGASLSVAGAQLLGQMLAEHDDPTVAIEAYEKQWRPLAEEKQAVGRRGTRWFLPSNRRTVWLRRLLLNASGVPGVAALISQGLIGKGGIEGQAASH